MNDGELVQFDDLEDGMRVRVEWDAGSLLESKRGKFVRFEKSSIGWYNLVVRYESREHRINTRVGLRVYLEEESSNAS